MFLPQAPNVRLRNLAVLVGALATLAVAAPPAAADSLVGTASNAWQSWTSSTLTDQNGVPYWNNGSLDGFQMNIGFCLTASGGCPQLGAGAPGTIPFWGALGGAADANLFFEAYGNNNAVLHLTIAGNAGTNVFGWFETDAAGTAIGALHPLFIGATTETSAEFSPTSHYGYYVSSAVTGDTWFTLSSGNPDGETGDQHFAVFGGAQSSTFWIGVEDLPFSVADVDFNDFIVEVRTQGGAVPEADSSLFVAAGLAALSAWALGRRRSSGARPR